MTAIFATFVHYQPPPPWVLLWCPTCPALLYVNTVPVWSG
jgi:hypothetical protein